MNTHELDSLEAFSKRNLDLLLKLSDSYSYNSLTLCVLDSIYSIGIRYATVLKVIESYCQYYKVTKHRETIGRFPEIISQESIDMLIDKIKAIGHERFAYEILKNRNRTSAKNGILKSEAVLNVCEVLSKHHIQYLQDVESINNIPEFEHDFKAIQGQGSGISLSYLLMLSGDDELIKPDRMILRYINHAIHLQPNTQEATQIIIELAKRVNLTPRTLDHIIWQWMQNNRPLDANTGF